MVMCLSAATTALANAGAARTLVPFGLDSICGASFCISLTAGAEALGRL